MIVKRWKITRHCVWSCGQTINSFGTQLLGYTLKLFLTSQRLPWQHVNFYCFVGKHPKFFISSGNMTTSYPVNLVYQNIFHLQKILLDNTLQNVSIWSGILNVACMQKIKIGHRAKFRDKNKCFLQLLFPVRAILSLISTSGVVRARFLRNFDSFSWRVHLNNEMSTDRKGIK